MKRIVPSLCCLGVFVVWLSIWGCREDVRPEGKVDTPVQVVQPIVSFSEIPLGGVAKKEYEFYLDACCRVYVRDSSRRNGWTGGSGTCFKIDGEYVYILTCRHVVGKEKEAKIEFWRDGVTTKRYSAVVLKTFKADAAVIAVKCSEFDGWLPGVIPIANVSVEAGDVIISVGCPGLGWQTLFEGNVRKGGYRSESSNGGFQSFKFEPPAKGGRSGSGIFKDGEIVGILWGSDRKTESLGVRCEDFAQEANDVSASEDNQAGGFFFTADWCKYCKEMKPVIEALVAEGYQIQEINYDRNASLAKLHGVKRLPAFVDWSGNTITGVKSAEELRKFFGSQGGKE